MKKLSFQLSLYPDYLNEKIGLDFSEHYHTDPEYRNKKSKEIQQWVYEKFGKWGCGDITPKDSYSVTTLGSAHLLPYLFGSPVSYSQKLFPEMEYYNKSAVANRRKVI